jgi:gas vesicle protein
MSEKNQGGGMGVMAAALTGAVVGAGVALLFAPASGKQTRGWLADRTRSLKDKASTALASRMDAVQGVTKEIGSDGEGQEQAALTEPARMPWRG